MIAKRTKNKTRHWRIHLVLFFLLAACAGVVGRLFYLQIVLGERYQVLAQGFEVFARDSQDISRGEIFLPAASRWPSIKIFSIATRRR